MHYSIRGNRTYFMTLTVIDRVDVFTRKNHRLAIIESLKHCQKERGLNIYAWCLMPTHLHLLVNSEEPFHLSDTIRDFKRFTSKKIVSQIIEEPESRREWMLERFSKAANESSKKMNYKFWQDGSHAIEIYTPTVCWQKINYIHQNPVQELLAACEEEYYFSSARNYSNLDNLLEVIILTPIIQAI